MTTFYEGKMKKEGEIGLRETAKRFLGQKKKVKSRKELITTLEEEGFR